MCGDDHSLNKCPVVEDYIHAGQIVRGKGHFLTYPDGGRFHPHERTNLLRTTVDEYYRNKRQR